MRIKLNAGDVLGIESPAGDEIVVEAYGDHVLAQVGPQMIYSAKQDQGEPWFRTIPPQLVNELRPHEMDGKARELRKGEAAEIINKISSRITNVAFWAECEGWLVQYIDIHGNRIYRKPMESDTDWVIQITIYVNGKMLVSVENIG